MAIIQAARPGGSGGGGGGLTITGFITEPFEQTTDFLSGGVILSLSQTPLTVGGIEVDYNGQKILGTAWSYAAGSITILFADPYVTTYDTPPFFQVSYPY